MARLAVGDVPPSAKLLYKVLEYDGPGTQQELVERSMLSSRTVRDALSRLQDVGLVQETLYVPDARQRLYRLADEDPPDGRE